MISFLLPAHVGSRDLTFLTCRLVENVAMQIWHPQFSEQDFREGINLRGPNVERKGTLGSAMIDSQLPIYRKVLLKIKFYTTKLAFIGLFKMLQSVADINTDKQRWVMTILAKYLWKSFAIKCYNNPKVITWPQQTRPETANPKHILNCCVALCGWTLNMWFGVYIGHDTYQLEACLWPWCPSFSWPGNGFFSGKNIILDGVEWYII